MKFRSSLTALALLMIAAAPAHASTELAQKKNCMACHAVDKRVVGPSYKEVATKYAGQKDAPAMLAQKVIKGGVGNWGQIPMPSNPTVSEADARTLVAWILATK